MLLISIKLYHSFQCNFEYVSDYNVEPLRHQGWIQYKDVNLSVKEFILFRELLFQDRLIFISQILYMDERTWHWVGPSSAIVLQSSYVIENFVVTNPADDVKTKRP